MLRAFVIAGVLAFLGGGVLTHYLEHAHTQQGWPLRVRALFYDGYQWDEFNDAFAGEGENFDPEQLEELDALHPGRVWWSVRGPVRCVLKANIDAGPPPPWGYCQDRPVDEAKLLTLADWVLGTAHEVEHDGRTALLFPYTVSESHYGLRPPWFSGLAQGRVGEVILAAYFLSGEERYREAARAVAHSLRVPVAEGGVAVDVGEGALWFEEFAAPAIADDPPRVLNGHMFAMEFLYWMRAFEPRWDGLYQRGYRALTANIERYLSPSWDYYDLQGTYANPKYHRIHIDQLEHLQAVNGTDPAIGRAIAGLEWRTVVPLGVFERLLFQSNRMLLFLFGVHALAVFVILFPPLAWRLHKGPARQPGAQRSARQAAL